MTRDPGSTLYPSQPKQYEELHEHLKLLKIMRERRLYAGAKEVIFDLEQRNLLPEKKIWLELEEEKAALFIELGDWWRATLSYSHILQHPEASTRQIADARVFRAFAAFEAGDFRLAKKDLDRQEGLHPFGLEMLEVKLTARLLNVSVANEMLSKVEPQETDDYCRFLETKLDLARLDGKDGRAEAKALVILSETKPDLNEQALAWIDYLASLQWEPLRIRNDRKLSELLPFSARATRLVDEISSPGLDLFRSTRAQTLIQSLRFDSHVGVVDPSLLRI